MEQEYQKAWTVWELVERETSRRKDAWDKKLPRSLARVSMVDRKMELRPYRKRPNTGASP